ncbi:MAG: hypothetical protein ACK57T_11450 [Dolichospermum sp.]
MSSIRSIVFYSVSQSNEVHSNLFPVPRSLFPVPCSLPSQTTYSAGPK